MPSPMVRMNRMSEEARVVRPSRGLARARRLPLISMLLHRLDSRQQEIVALLRRTRIFSELGDQELLELLHVLHERRYAAGETVFLQGEPGLGLYVVHHGEVEVKQSFQDGTHHLARLGPGEIFGEVSFLDGGVRSANVAATQPTGLIGFYRTELMNLLNCHPVLASHVLLALGRLMGLRMRAVNAVAAK